MKFGKSKQAATQSEAEPATTRTPLLQKLRDLFKKKKTPVTNSKMGTAKAPRAAAPEAQATSPAGTLAGPTVKPGSTAPSVVAYKPKTSDMGATMESRHVDLRPLPKEFHATSTTRPKPGYILAPPGKRYAKTAGSAPQMGYFEAVTKMSGDVKLSLTGRHGKVDVLEYHAGSRLVTISASLRKMDRQESVVLRTGRSLEGEFVKVGALVSNSGVRVFLNDWQVWETSARMGAASWDPEGIGKQTVYHGVWGLEKVPGSVGLCGLRKKNKEKTPPPTWVKAKMPEPRN